MSRRSSNDDDPGLRLMSEVRCGNVETASKMIDEFGLFYSEDWLGGYNLVRIALENDHLEVAKMLLNKHAEVNIKHTEPAETLLHIAARSGATEIVEMLLNRGAYVDAMSSFGQTPLHYAANNLEIVRLLLDRNATVNLRDHGGSTAPSIAVLENNLAVVEELLNHFSKLADFRELDLNSLLCEAAQWTDEAMVALLLRYTTEETFTHQHEVSPLHCAARYGKHNMIKMFLDRGADIDMPDKNGKTVLHAAIQGTYSTAETYYDEDTEYIWVTQDIAKESYLPTVKEILRFRPDIQNEVNRHTLSKAITKHKYVKACGPHCYMIPIVDALLSYGLTVRPEDAEDGVFMYEAIRHGHFEIVDAVLQLGTDANTIYSMLRGFVKKITLLHMAVFCYQNEIAEFLVSKGADVNIKDSNGLTPIWHAIEQRCLIMAKMLMTSTSSAKVTGDDLCHAVRKLCPFLVKIILQKYPQIDVNRLDVKGIAPLHYAVINQRRSYVSSERKSGMTDIDDSVQDRLEMVEALLSAGAYVDSRTTFSLTALHLAVSNGFYRIVEVLLKHGADANCRTEQGSTPVTEAARIGNLCIVKILLAHSADINVRLKNGMTAVHAACEFGHVDVLKFLYQYGCDINTKDSEESTPLYIATFHGHSNVVQALLELGANVNAKNKCGRTALHLAAKYSWPDITQILLENGADTHARCEESMLPITYGEFAESVHEHTYVVHSNIVRLGIQQPHHRENIYCCELVRYYYTCQRPCREEILRNIRRYQREAAKMMTQQIGDSRVTFHDILTHSMHKLLVYVRKKRIVKVITARNYYYSKFPLYCRIVERRFQEALRRNLILLSTLESLNILTGNTLPKEIREYIVEYISYEDMKSLVVSSLPTAQM